MISLENCLYFLLSVLKIVLKGHYWMSLLLWLGLETNLLVRVLSTIFLMISMLRSLSWVISVLKKVLTSLTLLSRSYHSSMMNSL